MSDMYIARLARVVPPRENKVRQLNTSNVTAVVELDNDIFQFAPTEAASPLGANVVGRPGNYGRALLRIQAVTNDAWVLFKSSNAITVNSAANTGNTIGAHIPVNQDRDFEVDPLVDSFMGVVTQNGTSSTGSVIYWIVSFPLNYR